MRGEDATSRSLDALSVATLVLACSIPLASVSLGLATNAVYLHGDSAELAARLALGTLVYLPPYLLLVAAAVRGRRPAHAGPLVAGVAVVYLAGLPLIGAAWVHTALALGAAVLLGLPAPWSWSVFGVLVVVVTPVVATRFGLPALWPVLNVTKALAIEVMVRLVGSVRRLTRARAELVAAAVGQERLRVEAQIARAVGADLAEIVRRARVFASAGAEGPGPGAEDIVGLTDLSRHALATARHIVHGYRGASVRNEVQMAAGLLRAAGIEVDVREAELDAAPADLGPHARDRLHSDLAQVLRDPAVRRATLSVTMRDSRPRVELGVVGAGEDRP